MHAETNELEALVARLVEHLHRAPGHACGLQVLLLDALVRGRALRRLAEVSRRADLECGEFGRLLRRLVLLRGTFLGRGALLLSCHFTAFL